MNDDPLLPRPVPLRPEFRDRLRAETTRLLRRRAAWRRVAGLALAASLLLAAMTAWWLSARPEETPQAWRETTPRPAPRKELQTPPAAPAAVDLEWRAFDSPAPERTQLYLAAGDRYVQDDHDYAAAVRCYREALAAGGTALEIGPNDNWLVMALKLDRQKEN